MKKLLNFYRANKLDITLLLLLFLLVSFIYSGWFASGIIAKGDLRSWSDIALKEFFNFPSAWLTYEGGGYYSLANGFQLIHYPYLLFQGFVATIFNADFALVQRLTLFYPFLLFSIPGIYLLSNYLFKKRVINFFATLAYLLNPLVVLFAYFSHFATMILVYAIAPWIILFYLQALDADAIKERVKYAILAGATLSLALYSDIKIAYAIFGVLIALFIYYFLIDLFSRSLSKWKNLFNRSQALAIFGLVIFLLNLYWIIPLLFASPSTSLLQQEAFNLDKIGAAFSLFRGLIFYLMEFDFAVFPLIVTTIVVFSALFFVRKAPKKTGKILIFFSLWFLISAYFHKSGADPLPEIFIWMYSNVPGFQAFRNPIKIAFASVVPWALLFGFAVFSLSEFFSSKIRSGLAGRIVFKSITFVLVILLMFANLSWLTRTYPLAEGGGNAKHLSTFAPERISVENLQMEKFFERDSDKFRILYLPTDPAYGVLNNKHTAIYTPDLDPSDNPFLRYILGWRWYYSGVFYQGAINNLGQILSLKNIKYAVYLPSSDVYYKSVGTEAEVEQARKLLVLLKEQNDFKRVGLGEHIQIFRNQSFNPDQSIYLTENSYLINGGLDALTSPEIKKLDFNGSVFFLIGHHKDAILEDDFQVKNVINVQQDTLDLVMSTLPKEYYVDLWSYAQPMTVKSYKDKDRRGFWQEFENRSTLANTYGEIPLSQKGLIKGRDGVLDIPFVAQEKDLYEVWMRLGAADNNDINAAPNIEGIDDLISFELNGKEIFVNSFELTEAHNLEWVKLVVTNFNAGENNIRLIYKGEDRSIVIDRLAVLPKSELKTQIELTEDFLSDKNLLTLEDEATDNSSKSLVIKVEELHPTRYEVGFVLERPTYLVFRDNYDPYWELNLNGKKYESIKTVSGNNSFYIDSPGSYQGTLEFMPQKYVNIGSWAFILAWVLVIGTEIYLIFTLKGKDEK